MREKYELRWDGGGLGVIGVVYDPPMYKVETRGMVTGQVLIGGPARFEEQMRTALEEFRKEALTGKGVRRPVKVVARTPSKMKLSIAGVGPEQWGKGMTRLRAAGFTFKRVRAFRRLMN